MDPVEFRLKNHVGPEGQPGERITPRNEIMDTQPVEGGVPFSSNGLRECIEKGAAAFGWGEKLPQTEDPIRRGKGMAIFIYRGGAGGRSIARIRLERDGVLRLESGVMDVGEGSYTVLAQVAAEALGVDYSVLETTFGDSATTPDSPITAGSTVTFSAGLAVKEAGEGLRQKILEAGSEALEHPVSELDLDDGGVIHTSGTFVSFGELASHTGGIVEEASVSPGSPDYIVNSFGAHFAEVEVEYGYRPGEGVAVCGRARFRPDTQSDACCKPGRRRRVPDAGIHPERGDAY